MKRKLFSLLLAVLLCLSLTVPAFAAGEYSTEPPLVNPMWIAICLVIGFLLALIPMGILKGQIRNVHSKTEAADYTRKDSFRVQARQDTFLYRNVTRTPIPKNNQNNRK